MMTTFLHGELEEGTDIDHLEGSIKNDRKDLVCSVITFPCKLIQGGNSVQIHHILALFSLFKEVFCLFVILAFKMAFSIYDSSSSFVFMTICILYWDVTL